MTAWTPFFLVNFLRINYSHAKLMSYYPGLTFITFYLAFVLAPQSSGGMCSLNVSFSQPGI